MAINSECGTSSRNPTLREGRKVNSYAAFAPQSELVPFSFSRRKPGPQDVEIEILYCGVCHSDIHTAKGEWPGSVYPVVPGHEIVGRVSRVGAQVTKFKIGDLAGVGCMVDSCRKCSSCEDGLEQYCENGFVGTYNGVETGTDRMTYGGYSSFIVVDEAFTLRIPTNLDLKAVAPLLCAGITTYSPLRHWKVGKGSQVGIVGLGGLGHMGVKLAAAMGANVTVFTTTLSKGEDAKRLGATSVVLSKDPAQMEAAAGKFDFILNTVAANHDVDALVRCLKRDGAMVLVGAPEKPHSLAVFNLIFGRRSIAGSLIGGVRETQEMLDFCAENGVTADVELIAIDQINRAYDRMIRNDVKYRFVIDLGSLPTP